MRALVISGGMLSPDFAGALHEALRPDLVIAADRGLVVCEAAGIRPDRVIGDFDSLPAEVAARYGINRSEEVGCADPDARREVWVDQYPVEKDWSDTELAARCAVEHGADEICIIGGTGTRFDHVAANIALLYRLGQEGTRAYMMDPHNRIRLETGGDITIPRKEQYGTYVSFAAYGGPVHDLTLRGFKYALEEQLLLPGDETLTLSNEIAADAGHITWRDGALLIIESKD